MSRAAPDITQTLQAVRDGASITDVDNRDLCGNASKEINGLRALVARLQKPSLWGRFKQEVKDAVGGLGAFTAAALLWASAISNSYGARQIYEPAGPIILGVLVITGIILRARGNG
jgi:hypothetical protein